MKIQPLSMVSLIGLAAVWSLCAEPRTAGAEEPAPAYQVEVASGTAGHCCAECGCNCDPCDLQVCTIRVPKCVAETRVKVDIVKEPETREEKYTVFQLVPKTRKFEKDKCYLKHDVKSQVITEEKCHLVKLPVERTVNVKAYYPELREVVDPCGECPPQVCEVMVECQEQRTDVCEETQVAMTQTQREIFYCVKTPETQKIPCSEEKYFELVPVTKTRTVSVCVPKVVRSPYEVIVCKEIPQQIYCCAKCAKKHCK